VRSLYKQILQNVAKAPRGAGTTRTITALEHIELKCGQASIKLSKDGTVTIKGTKIDMN